jgi:hypothetical protein
MNVRCVSGFILWISDEFLGCIMKFVLRSYFRMFLDQILFKSVLELVQERENGTVPSSPCFRGFGLLCTVPAPLCVESLLNHTWSCFLLCFFTFHQLYYSCQVKHVAGLNFLNSECSIVSLRMICKTPIWCNQILIVKHWWSAVYVTSRMIFLMEYF